MVEFDEYELTLNRNPKCPWCGYEHHDAWEWQLKLDGDYTEHECDRCEKPFKTTIDIDVTYTTERIEEVQ